MLIFFLWSLLVCLLWIMPALSLIISAAATVREKHSKAALNRGVSQGRWTEASFVYIKAWIIFSPLKQWLDSSGGALNVILGSGYSSCPVDCIGSWATHESEPPLRRLQCEEAEAEKQCCVRSEAQFTSFSQEHSHTLVYGMWMT